MKRIIGGKAYNTETATLIVSVKLSGYPFEMKGGIKQLTIGSFDPKTGTGSALVEDVGLSSLYQTAGGAYFLVQEVKDGFGVDRIQPGFYPLSRKEALAWAEPRFDTDKIEAMFGEIAEAGVKSGKILLRLPETLKKRMEDAATVTGQSVNAWAMRCIERCLMPPATPGIPSWLAGGPDE
jgi:hypothetical protein